MNELFSSCHLNSKAEIFPTLTPLERVFGSENMRMALFCLFILFRTAVNRIGSFFQNTANRFISILNTNHSKF